MIENEDLKERISNMYKSEIEYIPIQNDNNNNITEKIKFRVLEWMMEVSFTFARSRNNYHKAKNLFERYISLDSNLVHKNNIQLIGMVCLIIIEKLDRSNPFKRPSIDQWLVTTKNAFTKIETMQCEIRVLDVVKWKLHAPTISEWCSYYLSRLPYTFSIETSMIYGMLMNTMDIATLYIDTFSQYKPSQIVAAAFYIIFNQKQCHNNIIIQSITTYTYTNVKTIINLLTEFNHENYDHDVFINLKNNQCVQELKIPQDTFESIQLHRKHGSIIYSIEKSKQLQAIQQKEIIMNEIIDHLIESIIIKKASSATNKRIKWN